MQSSILDNHEKTLLEQLRASLATAQAFYIAVAFVKSSGWRLLTNDITGLLKREGRFEIVFGLDFMTTEPRAIRDLISLQASYPDSVVCKAYADYRLRGVPNFHPKLYILDGFDDGVKFFVGSSNLTDGGLQKNVEVSLEIETTTDHSLAASISHIFLRLKTQPTTFLPNDQYMKGYEEAYKALQRKGREAARDAGLQTVLKELKHQEKPLQKASKTQLDVVKEAVAELTQFSDHAHLNDITELARKRAESLGITYDWTTFQNSVRGRLNENVVGKKTGLELFARPNNQPGTGLYRLADPHK